MPVILENRIADGNTFVANIGPRVIRRGGDQLSDHILALMAERTTQRIIGSSALHTDLLVGMVKPLSVSIIAKIGSRDIGPGVLSTTCGAQIPKLSYSARNSLLSGNTLSVTGVPS